MNRKVKIMFAYYHITHCFSEVIATNSAQNIEIQSDSSSGVWVHNKARCIKLQQLRYFYFFLFL